ncbi:MAG: hypothetical protein JWL81_1273, partial [Verrucomicrobiales bacterium]|nr:hypothetical protein [Verrucomicrobiales bacterium]
MPSLSPPLFLLLLAALSGLGLTNLGAQQVAPKKNAPAATGRFPGGGGG